MRTRTPLLVALACLVVASTACGSGNRAKPAAHESPSSSASTSSTSSTSTTTPQPATSGTEFRDPQGTYTMRIGTDWKVQQAAFTKEAEVWALGPVTEGFGPSVNVVTQAAPSETLAAYLDRSVASGKRIMKEFALLHSGTVAGIGGAQLGSLEYQGQVAGRSLHFLAIIAMAHDRAQIATLTTRPGDFTRLRRTAEPYMLTLQAL